jgi:hypothetical protein
MHWDVLVPGRANDNLAASIKALGFPSLRTLRAPSDHHGVLQSVCKPRSHISLPSDHPGLNERIQLALMNTDRYVRNLCVARIAAQMRIEHARSRVVSRIVVTDDGTVKSVVDIYGYIGTLDSKINYSLEPDVPGSDNAVIDVLDIMDKRQSFRGTKFESCTGEWNSASTQGKKWWSHVERYRWKPTDLMTFF